MYSLHISVYCSWLTSLAVSLRFLKASPLKILGKSYAPSCIPRSQGIPGSHPSPCLLESVEESSHLRKRHVIKEQCSYLRIYGISWALTEFQSPSKQGTFASEKEGTIQEEKTLAQDSQSGTIYFGMSSTKMLGCVIVLSTDPVNKPIRAFHRL